MLRFAILGIVAAGCLATVASAQVTMRLKIADGSRWTTTQETKVHQKLTLGEMEIETKVDQKVVATTTAGKRGADGSIEVVSKIDSLTAAFLLPGGVELEFDSTKKVEPQGTAFDFLLDVMMAVSKMETTMVHDKDNLVKSVKLKRDEVDKLDGAAKALVKDQLNEKYLAKAVNQEFNQLPEKAVRLGDTWKRTRTARLGGGQTFTFKSTYKYEGPIKQDGKTLQKISFQVTDVAYDQDAAADSPAKVTASELKSNDSAGTLLFDPATGRIALNHQKLHITGSMTLEIGGKEIPAKLDLTMEVRTRVK